MSLFDDLATEVAEAKKHFKNQLKMIQSLMEFMLDELPKRFGGLQSDYTFLHPTEPGATGRTTLLQQIVPLEGNEFSTTLSINAGLPFLYCLKFTIMTENVIIVKLAGVNVNFIFKTNDEDDKNGDNFGVFCPAMLGLAVQKIRKNPVLADSKSVIMNEF